MKQFKLFACVLAIIGWNVVAASDFGLGESFSRALSFLPTLDDIKKTLDPSKLPVISSVFDFAQKNVLNELSKGFWYGTKDVTKHLLTVDMIWITYKELLECAPAVFNAPKQVVAGLPLQVLSSSVNLVCSSLQYSESIKSEVTPNIDKMQFQLRTACSIYSFSLQQSEKIVDCPAFDPQKKVVIFASGWSSTVNTSDNVVALAKAYNCRNDTNFLAIDAARFVDTLYSWAVFNSDQIGAFVAQGLQQLEKVVPLKNIHLIGHSLGAHIVGAAARYFYENTGRMVPRVTGLDPAKPCFNEGEALVGLQRGYAEFVDIIHSNSGVMGMSGSVGDVDFFPGGSVTLVPGCVSATCAHDRAWMYFVESVYPGNENGFMAKRCTSLKRLSRCQGPLIPMGYATPTNVKGNYFLDINSELPFGKDTGSKSVERNKACGMCK